MDKVIEIVFYVIVGLFALWIVSGIGFFIGEDITNKKWEEVLFIKGYGEYTIENREKVFKLKEIKHGNSN